MSVNAIAKRETSGLEVVESAPANVISAYEWNERRIQFIRDNFANGAPEPEFNAFIQICKRRGLAPEEKQIYLIPRKGKWTPQTSIDGSRLIAERSGVYAGSDEADYIESGLTLPNGRPYPTKATVTVYKIVGGVRCPFTASAYWVEYNGGENLWLTMPHVMLAKSAESQALRKAFPADLSGLYTTDEMDQAGKDERLAPKARASVQAPPNDAETAMKSLHAEAKKHDISHESLHDLAVAAYNVPSLTECTAKQLTGIRVVARDCTADEFLTVLTVAQEVATATDPDWLADVARQVDEDTLPDIAKRLLKATIKRVGESLPVAESV